MVNEWMPARFSWMPRQSPEKPEPMMAIRRMPGGIYAPRTGSGMAPATGKLIGLRTTMARATSSRGTRRDAQPPPSRAPVSPPSPSTGERLAPLAPLAPFAGPAAIVLVSAAALAWTWRKWPDVIVDYGREIYLAWRLSRGGVLYVDAAHFSGPLSPYLNAL